MDEKIVCIEEKKPLFERLKQMKEKARMTTHQISVNSSVPESTISRILSGDTDRPSFLVVSQIVAAMGGSLDVLAGIKREQDVFASAHMQEKLDAAQKELDRANARIATLEKWVVRLFVVLCALVGAIIIILILDRLNGDWGYWRY